MNADVGLPLAGSRYVVTDSERFLRRGGERRPYSERRYRGCSIRDVLTQKPLAEAPEGAENVISHG